MVAADAIGAVEGIGGEKVASSIKAASGLAMDAGGKVGDLALTLTLTPTRTLTRTLTRWATSRVARPGCSRAGSRTLTLTLTLT